MFFLSLSRIKLRLHLADRFLALMSLQHLEQPLICLELHVRNAFILEPSFVIVLGGPLPLLELLFSHIDFLLLERLLPRERLLQRILHPSDMLQLGKSCHLFQADSLLQHLLLLILELPLSLYFS